MPVKFNTNGIGDIKYGTLQIGSAYYGTNKVWERDTGTPETPINEGWTGVFSATNVTNAGNGSWFGENLTDIGSYAYDDNPVVYGNSHVDGPPYSLALSFDMGWNPSTGILHWDVYTGDVDQEDLLAPDCIADFNAEAGGEVTLFGLPQINPGVSTTVPPVTVGATASCCTIFIAGVRIEYEVDVADRADVTQFFQDMYTNYYGGTADPVNYGMIHGSFVNIAYQEPTPGYTDTFTFNFSDFNVHRFLPQFPDGTANTPHYLNAAGVGTFIEVELGRRSGSDSFVLIQTQSYIDLPSLFYEFTLEVGSNSIIARGEDFVYQGDNSWKYSTTDVYSTLLQNNTVTNPDLKLIYALYP